MANRQSSGAILADLKNRLSEIYDLNAAGSVLNWDQATYMPNGGAISRGHQSALLRRLAHERLVDPTLGRLMDQLEPRVDKLSADDASLFSTLHEAGHAMYEQGVNAAYEGTPLGSGVSAGVHESQSRLWENFIVPSIGSSGR
jgi:Zn-dependent M32 family carboxypeptidase